MVAQDQLTQNLIQYLINLEAGTYQEAATLVLELPHEVR
jgi:hypothetical protein